VGVAVTRQALTDHRAGKHVQGREQRGGAVALVVMGHRARTPGHPRQRTFVSEVFSSLGRKDRCATAGLYVRGLMPDGQRKSMQPMAARLRVDHQRLQQFVTSSPWEVEPVRKALSRKACALIEPEAWVIADTGFVKDGDASACVARQYSGTLGEAGGCMCRNAGTRAAPTTPPPRPRPRPRPRCAVNAARSPMASGIGPNGRWLWR